MPIYTTSSLLYSEDDDKVEIRNIHKVFTAKDKKQARGMAQRFTKKMVKHTTWQPMGISVLEISDEYIFNYVDLKRGKLTS